MTTIEIIDSMKLIEVLHNGIEFNEPCDVCDKQPSRHVIMRYYWEQTNHYFHLCKECLIVSAI